MLSAVPIGSKEPIAATKANGQQSWLCPDCQGLVYLRRRYGWTDHFCHKTKGCSTKLIIRNTDLHDLGKQMLTKRLRQVFDGELFSVQTEQAIGKRRADVVVRMGEAIFMAAECQLSAIGVRELEMRSRDYFSCGASVSWWFSPIALSQTVKHWCQEFLGQGRWEQISHPQLKLTGFIPDRALKEKAMERSSCKSTGDLLLDLIGIEAAKEMVLTKLNDAIAARDSSLALSASALWTKLDEPRSEEVEQSTTLFPLPVNSKPKRTWTDKGGMVYTHQILWLLNIEPLNCHSLIQKAEQTFQFSDREWETKTSKNGNPIATWQHAYEICFYSLGRYYNLTEIDTEASSRRPKQDRGKYYRISDRGKEELYRLNNEKALPLLSDHLLKELAS